MLPGLLCSLCLALCFAGCPTQGGQASAAQTVTQAWQLFGDAACYQMFHCHMSDDDLLGLAAAFQNEENCMRILARYFESDSVAEFRLFRQLESANALRVDATELERCVNLARSCSPLFDQCKDVFEGLTSLGESCARSEQCAGNGYCAGASDDCEGICTARVPIGASCDSEEQCSAGSAGVSYCSDDGDRSICIDVTERRARRGEVCGNMIEAGGGLITCEADSWCDISSRAERVSMGTCKAPLPLGADCEDDDEVCVAGALCSGESPAMRCNSVALRQGGQPCKSPAEFGYCDVISGFTCGDGGECVALGDGSLGSRCDRTDLGDLVPCDDGLFCDPDSKTCEAPRLDGAACEGGYQCKTHSCDWQTGTCGPARVCHAI
jgi:hypothetical protein